MPKTIHRDASVRATKLPMTQRAQAIYGRFTPQLKGQELPELPNIQTLVHVIGRNEPCSCRSGKKFKLCCGR